MAARLAANPQMTRQQRNTVEHPFGTIKHAMNRGHFLLKRLRQVRAEFSLSTLVYNLLRVITSWESKPWWKPCSGAGAPSSMPPGAPTTP